MSSTAENPSAGRTESCPYTLASPGMSPRKSRTGGPTSFKSTPPLPIAQTRASRRFRRFRPLFTRTLVIEHIESQSIPNYGIIKIFFQPTVNINAALAQVSAMSQTVLKQMPAGITPPLILSFDASSVPILQLALSSDTLSETTLFDDASSFIRPQLASVAGPAIPLPYGGKGG